MPRCKSPAIADDVLKRCSRAASRSLHGRFNPQLIARYQGRFPGFDEKIKSLYARGMTTREISGHIQELYGVGISADLVSTITDAVLDEVAGWQSWPLEPVYPVGTQQGDPYRASRAYRRQQAHPVRFPPRLSDLEPRQTIREDLLATLALARATTTFPWSDLTKT